MSDSCAVSLLGGGIEKLQWLANVLTPPSFSVRFFPELKSVDDLPPCDIVVLHFPHPDDRMFSAVHCAASVRHRAVIAVVENGAGDHELDLISHGAQEVLGGGPDAPVRLHGAILRTQRRQQRHRVIAQPTTPELAAMVLDRLPMAVILLTAGGRVVVANDRARQLIAVKDALLIDGDGRLRLAAPGLDKLLHQTVRAVCGNLDSDGALSAARPSCLPPLSILVSPVGEGANRGAVLFIAAPEDPIEIHPSVLCGLYGFTPAEAKLVLGLVRGSRLEDIAVAHDLSTHTVRAQLKSVFRRTGTARQSELIKLVLTGPAALKAGV